MFPQSPSKYPEFVADQLLTSDNLNDLFGYLDEQGRMTRTNLIGIGIVCGLEVKPDTNGTGITITKGTGVTSEGYLVATPEIHYTRYMEYDAEKPVYYDRLVDNTNHKRFTCWELVESSVTDATPLDLTFLNGNGVDADRKVVVMFVELLQIDNKNCNPNSCDDKGITINVNLRPLLIRKGDVDNAANNLANGLGSMVFNQNYTALSTIRMRRFDVPNTQVASTADLFTAYRDILTSQFLGDVEDTLTDAWNVFSPVVGSEYSNTNPFSGLANSYHFLHDGSISKTQLLNIQYYYDFFSDLVAAYDEFRHTGMEILSMCCPDSSLFPRHLLLDLAIPDTTQQYSAYRHYFIYSPLFQQRDLLGKLKSLFRRIALMRGNFQVPAVNGATMNPDPYQRITPSRLDESPISHKAIPYYYTPNVSPNPLFKFWNHYKTKSMAADENLSYNAVQYSAKPYVTTPLEYDLEPYNFLRVEGHVGKRYTHVLRQLKNQIEDNRLPFDVIALSTDDNQYRKSFASHNVKSLKQLDALGSDGLSDIHCFFRDLEAIYDTIKGEMLCTLCKELRYYYEIPMTSLGASSMKMFSALDATGDAVFSKVSLFASCGSANYRIKPRTFGIIIEKIYEQVGDHGEIGRNEILEALGFDESQLEDANGDGTPDDVSASLLRAITLMEPILELPIYLIRLSKFFTADLHNFDVKGYCRMIELITSRANNYKRGYALLSAGQRMSIQNSFASYRKSNINGTAMEMEKTGAVVGEVSTTPADGAAGNDTLETEKSARLTQQFTTLQSGLALFILQILILEDLLDHLDALIYNCKCRALMGVKEEYLRRVAELTELRQFGNFTAKHPGIQHKAGVPMGGTFIIVYHRTTSVNDPRGVVVLAKGDSTGMEKMVPEEKMFKIESEEKQNIQREQELMKEDERIRFEKRLRKKFNSGSLEALIQEIDEGTVIADFYLPYLCYSNCPPIVYQVNDVIEEPVTVTLGLQPNPLTQTNVYSADDATAYEFSYTPANGTLNNGTAENGVSINGSGKYVFTPKALAQKLGTQEKLDISFTYTKDGVTSSEVKVTVYNIPTAAIVPNPDDNTLTTGSTVSFTGNTQFANTLSWKIDNGSVLSTTNTLDNQVFNTAGTFKIILTATQSATSKTATADYTLTILDKPTVDIKTTSALPSVISVGDTYTFSSSAQNAQTYKWLENNLQISTNQQLGARQFNTAGTFVIKLQVGQTDTAEQAVSNSITVNVRALPVAVIMTVPTAVSQPILPGTTITFNSAPTDADTFNWVVKNTATGAEFKSSAAANLGPVAFTQPGSFVVMLKAGQTDTGKSSTSAPYSIIVSQGKVCADLKAIIDQYGKLSDIDKEHFDNFNKNVLDKNQINKYFEMLIKVAGGSIDEQIKFFDNDTSLGKLSTDLIMDWMQVLYNIITNSDQVPSRLLALETYRLLADVAMYIACIRKSDIKDVGAPTNGVFDLMLLELQGRTIKSNPMTGILTLLPNMSKEEQDRLKALLKDVDTESARLAAGDKPDYKDILEFIIEAIKTAFDTL